MLSSTPPFNRSCNALESFFAEHNVRFAAAAKFAHSVPVRDADIALYSAVTASTIAPSVLRENRRIWSMHERVDSIEIVHASWMHSLEDAVQAIVFEHHGAQPIAITLLVDRDVAFGAVIDVNHAIIDARVMMGIVQNLFLFLQQKPAPSSFVAPPPDATKFVQHALLDLPYASSIVPPALALCDVVPEVRVQETPRDVRASVPPDIVARIRAHASVTRASVTGRLAACIALAFAELYLSRNHVTSCRIAVSVLVDLRAALHNADSLALAIGTVVATFDIARDDLQNVDKFAALATSHIRASVARGDALMSAKMMYSGLFNAPELAATVELSSHGVYDVPYGAKLLLAQRFDSYKGVSFVAHTDRGSNTLHVVASSGTNVESTAFHRIVEQTVVMYKAVPKESGGNVS